MFFVQLHSGKLTWQWKMGPWKMYFLLTIWIFHCYVSLPEGNCNELVVSFRKCRNSEVYFWALFQLMIGKLVVLGWWEIGTPNPF